MKRLQQVRAPITLAKTAVEPAPLERAKSSGRRRNGVVGVD
jgi:hypothetical protein